MKVEYQGGLHTEAIHLDSQTVIETDAPKDNQGRGEKFSPTDLLATSLASCKLTIMAMKARTLGLEESMKGVTVQVQKVMTKTPPRKVQEIVLTFDWKGLDQQVSSEQMDQLKQAALSCPVALSLDSSVQRTLIW
ncbi:MAG: OsmC family protein [Bacteriovoracaceae bacterium]